jgi:S-adenosylmethionine/arginine decarboxylase-like enzyme
MTTEDSWGYHLILNCKNGNKEAITSPEKIKEFSKKLVDDIEMIPYGEPQIVHFADHCDKLAGWTLIQLIETSNIMAHFCDMGDCYFDLFSCKMFEQAKVLKLIQEYFQFENISVHFLVRQA